MDDNINKEIKVTVLMPVYNGEKYLREAIDSILSQTFSGFEFLIINDGSTDRSVEIINSYEDPRIRLIDNDGNLGVAATLNEGLKLAEGKYIARMDCDDVSLPTRLEKQVEFMDSHPLVGISGTWIEMVGAREGCIWKTPVTHEKIVCTLLFESALAHPSVIIRKSVVDINRLEYDPSFKHVEDYELWLRASRFTRLANLGEVHLLYRIHPDQIGERYFEEQLSSAMSIRSFLFVALGINPSAEELKIHREISLGRLRADKQFVALAQVWLHRLKEANRQTLLFPEPDFSRILASLWLSVCKVGAGFGLWTLAMFVKSKLGRSSGVSLGEKLDLIVRCCVRENG